jgi:1,4-alpha-glucan branching enzyme
VGNQGSLRAEAVPHDGQPASAEINLPPLGVVWLAPA